MIMRNCRGYHRVICIDCNKSRFMDNERRRGTKRPCMDSEMSRCPKIMREMVGVGDGSENMLAPVSIVKQYDEPVYDKFVKPKEAVTDYGTFDSVVRHEDLKNVSEHLKAVLKIGDSVGSELEKVGCIGPFVRLQEKGDICFLTAGHIFPESDVNELKAVYHPGTEDQAICGEVLTTVKELDTALVKISDDFIPKHCTFVEVDSHDLSRAGLKFPYKMGGTTDLKKLSPERYIKRRIVVHCPNGRLLTGNLHSEKSITLDTDSPKCPQGASGSAVFLVEDNNSLSCIGILIGTTTSENVTFILIQDILEKLSLGLGQSFVIETFENKKDTDFRLDPYDAHIFNEALKKGFGKDRFVRVNVVGNYEQGKTSLTRRLLNQSLEGIERTDGIDVHVRKCKIKDTEWVSSSIEFDENDYLVKIAEGTSHMKYTKIETSKTYDEENKVPQNSMPSESNTDESNAKSVTDLQQSVKSEDSESISNFDTSGENTSKESKINESFIEKYSSQLKSKMDMPLDETLTANIWDFGGQFIYYATHQIFHSRDAIYLLVFNLNKDLNEIIIDKDFPDRKSTMGCCLQFWLDSIQTYAGSDEEEDATSGKVSKPTVILVGTFKDQFEGNLEEKFDEVLALFVDDSARCHLWPVLYAISNTNMSDGIVKELKRTIFELGKTHAETTRIPLKWIPLEIALLAEKSKNILSFEEVKDLNLKNENLVEEEELKTFLKYLHLKGSLVFFDEEDLKGHIVVNPQYLIDAFRCVIGSESCKKDAKVRPLLKSLNKTAILENELLDAMWKKAVEGSQKEVEGSQKEVEGSQKEVEKDFHFYKNKEVLLMFLQKHRILCNLCIMDEAGKMIYQDKYMIPSLLKHCCEEQKLKTITCNKCATRVSLGLQIGKTALLTSLFAKITAGALGKWSPVVLDGQVLVFKNIGFFNLDMEHVGEVKLEPGKGIQLTVINQCPEVEVEGKVCDYFRRYIENLIKHEFHKFKSNTFSHYLACNHPLHTREKNENTYDLDMVRDKERARCPNYQGHDGIKCKSAIDEWFLPGKITDLYSKKTANRRVTRKELSRIAECIGHNWRLLGVALGVRDVDIDHIEMTYPGQVPTCIYMMLCKWEQIEQDGATLLQLITCIEDKPVVKVDKDMIKNIIEGN